MSTKIKIQKKTEFRNVDVRRMLGIFFNVPMTDKLNLLDLTSVKEVDENILYASQFEVDEDGYIKDYRLLTSQKKYIGIRIADNCWVCTARSHRAEDVKWIGECLQQNANHTENAECKNDLQLGLEF
jgi:hypothetical protein